jgi:hypothetical protein
LLQLRKRLTTNDKRDKVWTERQSQSFLFGVTMLFIVRDSDGVIYGIFSTREKANECLALVHKYHGIDPEEEYFGWWATVDSMNIDACLPILLIPKEVKHG